MRFETTTTAFEFIGTHRDRTNARVEGSEFARYLPKVCARAWLAVHSCIGFTGSFLGPLAFGAVLDIASPTGIGGDTVSSWVWAYVTSAAVVALGPVFLYLLRNRETSA